MRQIVLMLLTITLFTMLGAACKEKGPLQKAGEKADEGINDAKRKIEDATD